MIDPNELVATLRLQTLEDWLSHEDFATHIVDKLDDYRKCLEPIRDAIQLQSDTERLDSTQPGSLRQAYRVPITRGSDRAAAMLERWAPLPSNYIWQAEVTIDAPYKVPHIPGVDACVFTVQVQHTRARVGADVVFDGQSMHQGTLATSVFGGWVSDLVHVRIVYLSNLKRTLGVDPKNYRGLRGLHINERNVLPEHLMANHMYRD